VGGNGNGNDLMAVMGREWEQESHSRTPLPRTPSHFYAIARHSWWRHYACELSLCPCVTTCLSLCVILWARYFINRLGNFTKFTTLVHLETKTNWLDFEVKRSKVKGQGHDQTKYGQRGGDALTTRRVKVFSIACLRIRKLLS